MTDHPILFSAPMIRALLDGRKTQDRPVLKPQPIRPYDPCSNYNDFEYGPRGWGPDVKLPYAVGDRLWVRESCATWEGLAQDAVYQADTPADEWWELNSDMKNGAPWKIRSPIHMPRWASRLTLTVTDVRVQRLQDISRGDAMGEGCPFPNMAEGPSPRDWFADLWNSLHGPDAWAANPWVAACTFTVHRCNIDQIGDTQ